MSRIMYYKRLLRFYLERAHGIIYAMAAFIVGVASAYISEKMVVAAWIVLFIIAPNLFKRK